MSDVYLKLQESKSKRFIILNSAKALTEQLQAYEIIKEIRQEKIKRIEKLKKVTSEIKNILSKIKIEEFKDLKLDYGEDKQKEMQIKKKSQLEQKPVNDNISRLREDLTEIERKLASLY